MISNVRAVVLWSRRSREADKLVSLYSREIGRTSARATSAARATAKFAALTEPFVESDMALYRRPGEGWGKIVGGRLVQSFPALRLDLQRSTAAAWICEILFRLTPEEQPSPEKYELLVATLTALQQADQFATLRLAFAVRFLRLAGFGLDNQDAWRVLRRDHPGWADSLEGAPLADLGQEAWSAPAIRSLEHLAGGLVMDHLNRPLQVNRFRQMTGIRI